MVGWPDLVLVLGLLSERDRVDNQRLDLRGKHRETASLKLRVQGIQQYLKCRQTLLTIDDAPLLHRAQGRGELLHDESTEEVRGAWILASENIRESDEILPERLPLPLL